MRQTRDDLSYQIDALAKGLKVLHCLEGTNFEPLPLARIAKGSGFSPNFCLRALRTLKVAGFAAEMPNGWTVGPKLLLFSQRFNDLCLDTAGVRELTTMSTQKDPDSPLS